MLTSCSTRTFVLDDRALPQDGGAPSEASIQEPLSDAQTTDTGPRPVNVVHELPPELKGKPLSYYQHAKVILDARCSTCHRSDAFGPFALDDYDQAQTVSSALAEVVANQQMPPFLPSSASCRPLRDVRAMPDWERAVLETWVAQGAAAGDPGRASELTIALPGDILTTPSSTLPLGYLSAVGDADLPAHRCYGVDPGLTSDTAFAGFFVTPSNARSLRRALVHLVLPGREAELTALDAQDAQAGYDCFYGTGIDGAITLSDWVVGQEHLPYPAQSSVVVPMGSRFVVELDEASGRGPDSPSLMLYAAQGPVTLEPSSLFVLNTTFLVPRDVRDATANGIGTFVSRETVPAAVGEAREGKVWGASALMHLRGKSARLELVRANGDRECLLDLPAFELEWAGGYRFVTPLTVAAGDRVELTCRWDNSEQNQPIVAGEPLTSKDLTFGPSVLDETCVGSLIMTP